MIHRYYHGFASDMPEDKQCHPMCHLQKKSEPRDKAANVCYYARAPGINVCSQIATKGLRHHNPSSLQQPIIVVIAILQNGNIHSCVKI